MDCMVGIARTCTGRGLMWAVLTLAGRRRRLALCAPCLRAARRYAGPVDIVSGPIEIAEEWTA